MPEIKLRRRLKYAGDIHTELLKIGWPSQRAHEFVNNIPDADAVEVVHGYVLPAEEPKKVLLDMKCAICDQLMLSTDAYCPMCGAKMDGDANG